MTYSFIGQFTIWQQREFVIINDTTRTTSTDRPWNTRWTCAIIRYVLNCLLWYSCPDNTHWVLVCRVSKWVLTKIKRTKKFKYISLTQVLMADTFKTVYMSKTYKNTELLAFASWHFEYRSNFSSLLTDVSRHFFFFNVI